MKGHVVTLFTNPACHLCHLAKSALGAADAQLRRQGRAGIEWSEIDITAPQHVKWRDVYVFDVPVLHFSACGRSKLMHWVYPSDILAKLDEVQGSRDTWTTTMGKKRE